MVKKSIFSTIVSVVTTVLFFAEVFKYAASFSKLNVPVVFRLSFFKKILTENNYSRKECLLLPFETLKKGLKSNYGKN